MLVEHDLRATVATFAAAPAPKLDRRFGTPFDSARKIVSILALKFIPLSFNRELQKEAYPLLPARWNAECRMIRGVSPQRTGPCRHGSALVHTPLTLSIPSCFRVLQWNATWEGQERPSE